MGGNQKKQKIPKKTRERAVDNRYPNQNSRRIGNRASKKQNKEPERVVDKKMTGPVFYIILLIIIIDEIIDVALTLTGILALLTIVTHFFITSIVIIYLFTEKVSIFSSRKIALWVTVSAVEIIPGLSALPGYTFGFILTRVFENNEMLRTAATMAKGRFDKVAVSKAKSSSEN